MAHINISEAKALLTCVRRLAKSDIAGQRIPILVGSGVLKGSGTKSGSSGKALNFVLSELAGLALAFDLYVALMWPPFLANSSDAPTRDYSLADWYDKAQPLWGVIDSALKDDDAVGNMGFEVFPFDDELDPELPDLHLDAPEAADSLQIYDDDWKLFTNSLGFHKDPHSPAFVQ